MWVWAPSAPPRIPKRGDPTVDPSSPVAPIDAQRALPPLLREMVSYSLPVRLNRLTKSDLGSFDRKLLNSIEAVAKSAPYLENIRFRNDLILDTELRTSNALTIYFRNGGVIELGPGYDLSQRDRACMGVNNTVFFITIRMAWNNFEQTAGDNQSGTSSASATLRNAEVVWLENWIPSVFIGPVPRVEISFDHAEVVLDNRARAQQLSQLIKWEDEGAIVERWIENCLKARDGSEPSRRALGKFLKESWSEELKRQNGVKQNMAQFTASKWQPPGSGVLPENISLCSCGPIGFALVAISQWHKELRNSLCFLSEMEATITFPSREGTRDNTGTLVASKVTNPPSQYGDVGGAARAPAAQRGATEGSRPGLQQRAK
jgi:hypothetical protein